MSLSVLLALLLSVFGIVLIVIGANRKSKRFVYSGILVFCIMIAAGFITGNIYDFARGFIDEMFGS